VITILEGDCRAMLKTLPDRSVHCCVTSPPYYGLRSYGIGTENGEIGLEQTPDAYVAQLVSVFREVRRVLRDDGVIFVNLGDTYQNSKGQAHGVDPKQPARRHGLRPQDGPPPPGLKPKDLIGIPWMVAFALRADGWYLRQDIIWHKPNPMPESVTDRCTKAHEYIFLLSKAARYYFDAGAIAEGLAPASIERLSQPNLDAQMGSNRVPGKTNGTMKAVGNIRKSDSTNESFVPGASSHGGLHRAGRSRGLPPRHAAYPESSDQSGLNDVGRGGTRNKRSVWTVATMPFKEAHFATFPPDLIEPCILAGCPAGGVVLDPFGGAGTTGMVADRHGRDAILIELNPDYAAMARERLHKDAGIFAAIRHDPGCIAGRIMSDAKQPHPPMTPLADAFKRAADLIESGQANSFLDAIARASNSRQYLLVRDAFREYVRANAIRLWDGSTPTISGIAALRALAERTDHDA